LTPEIKGVVFGGIVSMPLHPDANMHGEIRCVIRTRLFSQAINALSRFGVEVLPRDLGRIWRASESHVEQTATMTHYGEVLACKLELAYLSVDNYHPIPADLMAPRSRRHAHK